MPPRRTRARDRRSTGAAVYRADAGNNGAARSAFRASSSPPVAPDTRRQPPPARSARTPAVPAPAIPTNSLRPRGRPVGGSTGDSPSPSLGPRSPPTPPRGSIADIDIRPPFWMFAPPGRLPRSPVRCTLARPAASDRSTSSPRQRPLADDCRSSIRRTFRRHSAPGAARETRPLGPRLAKPSKRPLTGSQDRSLHTEQRSADNFHPDQQLIEVTPAERTSPPSLSGA